MCNPTSRASALVPTGRSPGLSLQAPVANRLVFSRTNCKIVRMSHFYRELHDRELLLQGEQILREIDRRKMLEVVLLSDDEEHQETRDLVFPRRLASITIEKGKLVLSVERSFFRPF
jgi:hypothetical protein